MATILEGEGRLLQRLRTPEVNTSLLAAARAFRQDPPWHNIS